MAVLQDILEQIFGPNFLVCDDSPPGIEIQNNVRRELEVLGPASRERFKQKTTDHNNAKEQSVHQEGRVGNDHVCFDKTNIVGMFFVGPDHLSLSSQSNFSTIRANCGVFKGKWQYEVLLGSGGIMQLGWATIHSEFSQQIGVGDTADSFAYDGCRIRKWNISTYKYGEPWKKNDIIGCCIDMDDGCVDFYRNGVSLGTAFSNIHMGPGIAYFPAVSLALLENVVANFGSKPFSFPVLGYHPLQEPPHKELAQAAHLLGWMNKLLSVIDTQLPELDEPMSASATVLLVGQIIMAHLTPLLLNPYIVKAHFLPFLRSLCEQDPTPQTPGQVGPSARVVSQKTAVCASKHRKLMYFLDLLLTFTSDHDLKICMEALVGCLAAVFQCNTSVLEFSTQRAALKVLCSLVRHKQLRHHLLRNVLFDEGRLSCFMQAQIKESVMKSLVKQPWWETDIPDPSVEANKKSYMAAVNKIKQAVFGLEEMQMELLLILLDNTDGSLAEPSSRRIFLRKFRTFLHDYSGSSRMLTKLETLLPLTSCFFHRLLAVLQTLWAKEVGNSVLPFVPTSTFYDGSINYHSIERLGGVLSHLLKTQRSALEQRLGPSHPLLQPNTSQQQSSGPQAHVDSSTSTVPAGINYMAGTSAGVGFVLPMLARLLNQPGQAAEVHTLLTDRMGLSELTSLGPDDSPDLMGCMDAKASLIELLDGLILLFHLVAYKQIRKVSSVREIMGKYVKGLEEIQKRINAANSSPIKHPSEILKELQLSYGVLYDRMAKWACEMAFVRAAVFSCEVQANLAWLLQITLATMKAASEDGPLLRFLPYFYLDALTEIFCALGMLMPPFAPLEDIRDHEELLCGVVQYVCDHINDGRIRTAKTKDTLVKSLTNFMTRPTLLNAVQTVPIESRMNMLRFLLLPYENRAWAHSNWVLVRIWQGSPDAFAFRFQRSPHHQCKLRPKVVQAWEFSLSCDCEPCPSVVLQTQLRDILLNESEVALPFLNSVLNQLNWAFSEFIGMLQEIQNVSHRRERVLIESRQLKICATCFDLTLSLLRVLEMVASLALPLFTDLGRQSSNLLLSRLCQLLCQVLNRVSSQAGCFHLVTTLEIPDLENVDHFPILSAVCGVLLALLSDDINNFTGSGDVTVPAVAKALLTEPSFQMSSLTFVLGDNSHIFSLSNYKDDVSVEEISRFRQMLDMLEHYSSCITDTVTSTRDTDGDEMCTICYAFPISATFEPCKHQSCCACISHHLMNNKECFFCKANITKVIDYDDQVLYDASLLVKSTPLVT